MSLNLVTHHNALLISLFVTPSNNESELELAKEKDELSLLQTVIYFFAMEENISKVS